MYAVIRTGGKQYRVTEGDELNIEKLDGETGTTVQFDDVLLVGSEDETKVGTPIVEGASVTGTIVRQDRARKVIIFKMKRRKDSKLKKGHRQYFTRVRIDGIAV